MSVSEQRDVVSEMVDGTITVGEADETLEPYQTTYALVPAHQRGEYDGETISPREDRLSMLDNHLHVLEQGNTVSEVAIEGMRIPYKTAANSSNAARKVLGGRGDPMRALATPERARDYFESSDVLEGAKSFTAGVVAGIYGTTELTYRASLLDGHVGDALPALPMAAGIMGTVGYVMTADEGFVGREGYFRTVQEELKGAYGELLEDVGGHRIESVPYVID